MKMRGAALAVLFTLGAAGPAWAANPTMSDDFARMMDWLSGEVATGLGFSGGSTFDPPNEMRPWRIQPDVSLGVGNLPFDKSTFPEIQVDALAEKDPGGSLPDKMLFPNLTLHMRLGLPERMDLGLRIANMTTPKNYRLSEDTVGNGQSNSIGVALRRHFMGGKRPMVSVGGSYQQTFGYFNYVNKFDSVELTPGFFASSVNSGQLEWDVKSFGVNMVVSQAYGRWIPFMGAGFNHSRGSVRGRLEAAWKTPLIQPSVGEASNSPEPTNARVIFGLQRQAALFNYFLNGEVKTLGRSSGKTFVISTGLSAPFKVGAASSLVRFGRKGEKDARLVDYAQDEGEQARPYSGVVRYGRNKPRDWSPESEDRAAGMKRGPSTIGEERLLRYWTWNEKQRKPKKSKKKVSRREGDQPLIFIR
jgi:hypothetical protein